MEESLRPPIGRTRPMASLSTRWKLVCHDSRGWFSSDMNAGSVYEKVVRPLLFSIDPERAHHLTIDLLRRASHLNLALRLLQRFQPTAKPKTLFGVNFPNP